MSDKKKLEIKIKELLKRGLENPDDLVGRTAVLRGLMHIWNLQTADEVNIEDTHYYNRVGFTGFDGKIMTSIANNFLQYHKLTKKQYALVAKKMQKYWKQLLLISLNQLDPEINPRWKNIDDVMPKAHPQYWLR